MNYLTRNRYLLTFLFSLLGILAFLFIVGEKIKHERQAGNKIKHERQVAYFNAGNIFDCGEFLVSKEEWYVDGKFIVNIYSDRHIDFSICEKIF